MDGRNILKRDPSLNFIVFCPLYGLKACLQCGEIMFNDIPDLFRINHKIMMNKNIPEANNFGPWN